MWALLALAAVLVVVWWLAPREPVDLTARFDPETLGDDLDGYFGAAESAYDDLVPGTEKRVVWAGPPGAVTDLAVVYLHGYSGSSEELRPVPDDVAAALGANLIYTRLAGHGRDGAAMAEPRGADWVADLDEALAAGRRTGRRVLVIGTSTGGTLAALIGADPARAEGVAGVAFLSPNFRIRAAGSDLLAWPFVRAWLPLVLGRERGFVPTNEGHARYWTERYPSVSLVPLAALVARVRRLDLAATRVPALFVFAPDDTVVDPAATRARAADWGGPTTVRPLTVPPGNDPDRHVLGGDILSPGLTAPLTEMIVEWAETL